MAEENLDLFDIALLLNYERATTEPRFRSTKLREVALPGASPKAIAVEGLKQHEWNDNKRTWIVLDKSSAALDTHDTPSDFLPANPTALHDLSEQQLETIFFQARAHDGCYISIGLLQIFFGLFPEDTKLRIRHTRHSYMSAINKRANIQEVLKRPTYTTAIAVLPEGDLMISGHEKEMLHTVMGFAPVDDDNIRSILDLSSMQFGEAGRGPGPKGKQLFALDTTAEFETRLNGLADELDESRSQHFLGQNATPYDDWLKTVAVAAKKRWENREADRWCGHCGAPSAKSKCTGCGGAWYCGKSHQKLAWAFHKGYCKRD